MIDELIAVGIGYLAYTEINKDKRHKSRKYESKPYVNFLEKVIKKELYDTNWKRIPSFWIGKSEMAEKDEGLDAVENILDELEEDNLYEEYRSFKGLGKGYLSLAFNDAGIEPTRKQLNNDNYYWFISGDFDNFGEVFAFPIKGRF